MKTYLTILLLAGVCTANNLSEDLFIQGLHHQRMGQDSLACHYFGEAYKNDTSSIILQELYSASLIKTGRISEGMDMFRHTAGYYIREENWQKAFDLLKDVYRTTRNSSDGCVMATVAFNWGITSDDSAKINRAGVIWDCLERKALDAKDTQEAVNVLDSRIQANLNAIEYSKDKHADYSFYSSQANVYTTARDALVK